jgi:Domain of unknown function (DUF4268)
MYTKEQASLVKQKFWTSFGKYMQPVPSASGEKVHWINYKTGIKGIHFKMDADNNAAFVAIEFTCSDKDLQKKYYDAFVTLKKHFVKIAGKGWIINEKYETADGKVISTAIIELQSIKIFRESDWPAIISFFKQHIIALDQFWNDWKPTFEMVDF